MEDSCAEGQTWDRNGTELVLAVRKFWSAVLLDKWLGSCGVEERKAGEVLRYAQDDEMSAHGKDGSSEELDYFFQEGGYGVCAELGGVESGGG